MKRAKQCLGMLLTVILLCMAAVPAFAATGTQDSITATLTTDKAEYGEKEAITATLKVENNNAVPVSNVTLELLVPAGYRLANDAAASKQLDTLAASSSSTLTVTLVSAKNQDVPATGDAGSPLLWAVLVLASVLGIAAMGRRGRKIMLSLVLCALMLSGSVVLPQASAEGSLGAHSFDVKHAVLVGDGDVILEAIVSYDQPIVNSNGEMVLRANKSTVTIGDSQTLVLYLETNVIADSVTLYYGDSESSMNHTVQMYDTGTNADDIAGDGVYSVAITPNLKDDARLYFKAKYGKDSSNELDIPFFKTMDAFTANAMSTVSTSLDNLLKSSACSAMNDVEKAASITNLLNDFADQGMVQSGSVTVDADSMTVGFLYPENIVGAVAYGEFDSKFNGTGKRPARVEAPDSRNVFNSLNEPVVVPSNAAAQTVGSAIILNSFPAFETSKSDIEYRTTFYEELRTKWNSLGLATKLVLNPTVEYYKTLKGYNVICISTHGSQISVGGKLYSAVCLHDAYTSTKQTQYNDMLKDQQIVLVNTTSGKFYWILPRFFEKQYASNAFAQSFIFSECCYSLGGGAGSDTSKYDYTMPNTVIGRGAKAYVGFHNSVLATYCREFMRDYVIDLVNGKNSITAYNHSVSTYGANHSIWYKKQTGSTWQQYIEQQEHRTFKPLEDIAYAGHRGNGNATLVQASGGTSLRNGGFETVSSDKGLPTYWTCKGDVRTLTKMGSVTPYDKSARMAVITTGIGASTTTQISGSTEGSVISQSFTIPNTAKTLRFSYNFVSEEPKEFVGTCYNDSFVVKLTDSSKTLFNRTYESINTSTWKTISGVDFYGGDHTAFQTGWKTVSVDVSSYRGKTVTLSFMVVDVGDTLYDSACLIDHVEIQ